MMKYLLLLGLAGLVGCVSSTCQQDFNSCKSAYNSSFDQAKKNLDTLCTLGTTYLTCLSNLSNVALHPDCTSLASQIASETSSTQSTLNAMAQGCVQCHQDMTSCKTALQISFRDHAGDNTAICKDGQTYSTCVQNLKSQGECRGLSAGMENERKATLQQLSSYNCKKSPDVPADCQSTFNTCKTTYQTALPQAQTNAATLCRVGTNYLSCLKPLSDVESRPDCIAITGQVTTEMTSTRQTLNQKAQGCLQCMTEVISCQNVLQSALTDHANNQAAKCGDVTNFMTCTNNLRGKAECSAQGPNIDSTQNNVNQQFSACSSGGGASELRASWAALVPVLLAVARKLM